MTAGVSVPKPDEVLTTLRDRIEARNAVNAVAWPYSVHIQSARQARLRTRARGNQRRWRRDQFGPTLPSPADSSMTSGRRCAWKANLSAEMAVGDGELDAIIRLLGSALDHILSGIGYKQ